MTVIGWCDAYGSEYPVAILTQERKKALIERIRKRKYNFNHTDHVFLPLCAPVYDDGTICRLSKQQFDDVMQEAWKDMHKKHRLLPMDVITADTKNGILYEKPKYEPKEGNDNV